MKWRLILALVLFSAAACASVLGLRGRTRHRVFEHRAHLLQEISCIDCHGDMKNAGESGALHLPGTEKCVSCHEKPHTEQRCRDCHGQAWIEERTATAKHHLRFAHEVHLASVSGNCARCHIDVAEEVSPLLPPMASCLGCHQHEGQFDPLHCDTCHVDLKNEESRPASHVVHREDFVREHGAHAASSRDLCESCHSERFCASCHGVNVPTLPHRLEFDRPTLAGFHRANFRAHHREEAAADQGMCATCHTVDSCQRCHEQNGVSATGNPRFNPHPSGWVGAARNDHGPAARRDPVACASCHGGAGEMLCVDCHKVGGIGGNVHPPGWNSEKSLTDVPCRLCHTP